MIHICMYLYIQNRIGANDSVLFTVLSFDRVLIFTLNIRYVALRRFDGFWPFRNGTNYNCAVNMKWKISFIFLYAAEKTHFLNIQLELWRTINACLTRFPRHISPFTVRLFNVNVYMDFDL